MRARLICWFCSVAMALAGMSARGVDVARFELLKGVHYFQIEDGVTRLQTNNMYRFSAQVYADVAGDVLASSVTTPKAQTLNLAPDADGNPFRFRDKFDTAGKFENNYPNGAYSFSITGAHDGQHTMNFSITGDLYPSAPILSNYQGLQSLPFNEYNEISWQPFAGGTVNDFIQVQVEDLNGNNIWKTPDFGEQGALNGLALRTILPPEALNVGQVYVGTVRFVKVLQSASRQYLGALGTVGYYSRTEFTIRPAGTAINRLVDRVQLFNIKSILWGADGRPEQALTSAFARVDAAVTNQISGVRLDLPDGEILGFATNDVHDQFTLVDSLRPYPAGSYTFIVAHYDDTPNDHIPVDFPAGDFPDSPALANLDTYEGRGATDDLVISWLPWTNAGASDFIRVEVFGDSSKVWDSPNFQSPKRLSSNTTSVTIPGTNFVAGTHYFVNVEFVHATMSDTRTVPGGIVFGGYISTSSFQFTTRSADVNSIEIDLGQTTWEVSNTSAYPDSNAPFFFSAFAYATNSIGTLLGAQVKTPSSETITLSLDLAGRVFATVRPESSETSLISRYPLGEYRFQLDTLHDGQRFATATLFTNSFPPMPRVTNYQALHLIAYDQEVKVWCSGWPNADTNIDQVVLTITNIVTGKVIVLDPVKPTAGRIEVKIKGGTLTKNAFYVARLRFQRNLSPQDTEYPTVQSRAVVYSEVAFTISTFQDFRALAPKPAGSGAFNYVIANILANKTYRFNFSTNLLNWNSYTFTTNTFLPSYTITRPNVGQEFLRVDLLAN